MPKNIALSMGLVCYLDDEDYELVRHYKWYAHRSRNTHYAEFTRKIDGKTIKTKMHRLIMRALPGQIVDHINGDGLDNRRRNLRFVSLSQNAMNKKPRSDSVSGLKGIRQRGTRWEASIKVDGSYLRLGRFPSPEEAHAAYAAAAKRHFGDFARTR